MGFNVVNFNDNNSNSNNGSNISVSGGISGAITDPLSREALKHAEMYYETIRKYKDDIQSIANNTGYSYEQIKVIKDYLFYDEHELGDNVVKRFDASFEIAESWRRLMIGKDIKKHDLILIQHELCEMSLVEQGYSQDEAHIKTCEYYNYPVESSVYYKMLKEKG